MVLIGLSKMILGPNIYEFINNKATFQGGALYVSITDVTDFIVSKSCFIDYIDANSFNICEWNATVTFTGNSAKDHTAGHAIYATSLQPCMVINKGTVAQPLFATVDISEVFNVRGFNFDNNTELQPQIATDGTYLRTDRSTPLMVIPGEYYKHDVVVTDDFGQKVDTSLRVAIINKPGSNVQLDSALSSFISDEIQLTGKENNTATLHLRPYLRDKATSMWR